MIIERSYLEAHSVIDGLVLKYVFRTILAHPWAELDHVKRQLPHHNLFFPQETVTLQLFVIGTVEYSHRECNYTRPYRHTSIRLIDIGLQAKHC